MGTAAFERDAVVEIDGQKYRLLRKVSETCWQLEHTSTARISELEQEQLLRMYADRKLRFANGVAGIGRGKAHIEISETAKLRRLYVLAALKTDTLNDLKQAISKVWRKTNRPDQPPGCMRACIAGKSGSSSQVRTFGRLRTSSGRGTG